MIRHHNFTSKSDEVLVLPNECLHVGDQRVEWIVDTITSNLLGYSP